MRIWKSWCPREIKKASNSAPLYSVPEIICTEIQGWILLTICLPTLEIQIKDSPLKVLWLAQVLWISWPRGAASHPWIRLFPQYAFEFSKNTFTGFDSIFQVTSTPWGESVVTWLQLVQVKKNERLNIYLEPVPASNIADECVDSLRGAQRGWGPVQIDRKLPNWGNTESNTNLWELRKSW